MSSLDPDQHLHPSCRDKTTVSSDSSDTRELAKQPLQGLKLASHAVLEKAQQRAVGVGLQEIPVIKLPVKIDIIKHPNETDGKSTAVHAKILAPADVTIYTYPCIPELEKDKVVLVFPGPGAVSVQDMMQCLLDRTDSRSHDSDEPSIKRLKRESVQGATHADENLEKREFPLQRVVFIDSTWNQTNKISTDERLQDLLKVELKMRKTCFWRHQKGKPDTYLATIEAIYYFLKDFHEHCLSQEYHGEYDNLLFFYSYLHSVVNKAKISAGKC
ncbi:hypothetical protein INR49_008315 [Caranx melampygus]|nr:hypothetical protein INR49_008315 [Caranx melampygus]